MCHENKKCLLYRLFTFCKKTYIIKPNDIFNGFKNKKGGYVLEKIEKRRYGLTRNVIEKNKILGKNKRNIKEANVFTLLIALIVVAIPFTFTVTIIICVVLCPLTFLACIVGIKHLSLTEILSAEREFRKNRRRLHLRGPEYVRKKNKTAYSDSEEESLAERTFKYFKQRLDDFVEKYSTEDDSKSN